MSETVFNLNREILEPTSTIGRIYQNGTPICYTLEDTMREKWVDGKWHWESSYKVPKMTAIPSGRYQVIITFSGRFQRPTPQLMDVPDYTYIRIHPGNSPANTEGCILPGLSHTHNWVSSSGVAYDKLYGLIKYYCEISKVYLEITNPEPN